MSEASQRADKIIGELEAALRATTYRLELCQRDASRHTSRYHGGD